MRHRLRHYEIDMIHGPLFKKLLLFSIPLILTGILQLLYNAADIVVVGRYTGTTAQAAVSSTSALINLTVNLFIGLSVGASVSVASHYGAGRHKDVSQAVHTAIGVSVVAGVAVGIFGMCMARKLLEMTGTPEDVMDQAVTYLTIYFSGMPASMLYNFGAAILRAVGDTRRPLYYLTISGLVNVALNLIRSSFSTWAPRASPWPRWPPRWCPPSSSSCACAAPMGPSTCALRTCACTGTSWLKSPR